MKSPFVLVTLGLFAASMLTDVRLSGQDKTTAAAQPTAGQAFLEKLVGEFEVEKLLYKGGDPKRTKGTCKQSLQQNGKFLYSEFNFGEGDAKTTGLGIIGYIPESGLFISTWIDSRQTKMSMRQSREKFNGKEIVLFSGTLNQDPKARVSRTVTTLEEDGNKIMHRQFNIAEGKETIFMELHMKRK